MNAVEILPSLAAGLAAALTVVLEADDPSCLPWQGFTFPLSGNWAPASPSPSRWRKGWWGRPWWQFFSGQPPRIRGDLFRQPGPRQPDWVFELPRPYWS